MRTRRVLFFAEAVTLAHVARPIVLARALESTGCQPVMACDPRSCRFIEGEDWQTLPLHSISGAQFLQALDRGSPVYDLATLRDYLVEDLRLIQSVKPDLIVGDFRLSLSVSARLAGIPYAAISNAYWSPYCLDKTFPLPVLPITRLLPLPIAQGLFTLARPLAFSRHCAPLNRLRREHGLGELGNDLRRVYTDADFTLYADAPDMFPTENLPPEHQFLGPIIWSPPVALPPWWNEMPGDRPIIYVTLGSSGSAKQTVAVIEALAELPVTVMASMAGASAPVRLPGNVFTADYLPGALATARAQLVVCNGGSMTCNQAMAAGIAALGIARNMDQFLNMQAVVSLGAGVLLRADRIRAPELRRAAQCLLARSGERTAALAARYAADAAQAAPRRFADFVQKLIGGVC